MRSGPYLVSVKWSNEAGTHRNVSSATFTDRRVRNSEDVLELVGNYAHLRGQPTFESRVRLVEHDSVVVDNAGDVASSGGHRDDGTGPGEVGDAPTSFMITDSEESAAPTAVGSSQFVITP